jgi:hypothetical protein
MLKTTWFQLLLVSGLGVLLLLLWLLLPTKVSEPVLAPQDDTSRFFFGGPKVIGQEFIAPAGLAEIVVTIGTSTMPSGPLTLHLRHDFYGQDIRTSTVFSIEPGTTDVRFPLRPVLKPAQKLIWVLEAPYSPDLVWVYRELDATAYTEGKAFLNNRPLRGNFGFQIVSYQNSVQRFWRQLQESYAWERWSLPLGLLIALALTDTLRLTPLRWLQPPLSRRLIVLVAALSVGLHFGFISQLPLINDEGAYIQDVVQTQADFLPFRDFLTKGPLYLLVLKVWQLIAPHTIFGWRLFSALMWGVAVYFGAALARELRLPLLTQLLVAVLLATTPATLALTTPLLLQTAMVPVGLAALTYLMRGIRQGNTSLIVLAGLLTAATYFIRVSSIVLIALGAILIVLYSQRRFKTLFTYGATSLTILLVSGLVAVLIIGWQHTTVLFNLEAVFISGQRAAQAQGESDLLLRQLMAEAQTLWRSAPLLLSSLFLLPVVVPRYRRWWLPLVVAGGLLWFMSVSWHHLADMGYLLPTTLPLVRLMIIMLVFGIPLGWLLIRLLLPATNLAPPLPERYRVVAVVALWLVLLIYLYGKWGRFRESYLVEFIPPLALLTALTFTALYHQWQRIESVWLRRLSSFLFLTVIATSTIQGSFIALRHPHSGTMDQNSIREIAAVISQHVPPHVSLFTAQPAVTAFAQRPIMFGYAHPGWYLEERKGVVSPELRRLYFADQPVITAYLRDEAQFVLMDRRTSEIYFDAFEERQAILSERFQDIAHVPNPAIGEDFILYKRH